MTSFFPLGILYIARIQFKSPWCYVQTPIDGLVLQELGARVAGPAGTPWKPTRGPGPTWSQEPVKTQPRLCQERKASLS